MRTATKEFSKIMKREANHLVSWHDCSATLSILWCGENNTATSRSSRYLRVQTFQSSWRSSTTGPYYRWSIIFHERIEKRTKKERLSFPEICLYAEGRRLSSRVYLLHCTIVFTENLLRVGESVLSHRSILSGKVQDRRSKNTGRIQKV